MKEEAAMTTISRRTAIAGTAAAVLTGFAPAAAEPQKPRVEMQPDLGDVFTEAGTAGTFALLDPSDGGRIVVTDRERAEAGFLPASTFKIPNSLIALETGVVADADGTMFPWDKVVRDFDAWNQDHTLRSAFKASAVPVFQDIARKIGPERMQHYVTAFDYGNRDIGGAPIDSSWLNGNLRISALQQIDFLHRFYRGELPVSKQNQDVVRDIMLLEVSELGTLRGKTGAVGIGLASGAKATLGWLVGWLEHGPSKPYFFALNLDVHEPKQLAMRLPLVKTLLKRTI
jgi:beta-lactamase class D